MNMNNPFSEEKNRKLSRQEKSLEKLPKKRNEDIKPNIEIISKNIKKESDFVVKEFKKEPDFIVREIKKEPHFLVREIKKEPGEYDMKFVTTNLTKRPSKSKRRKRKLARNNKSMKKTKAKDKKKTFKKCKKSSQTKTENSEGNLISKKSTKKRRVKPKRKHGKKSRSLKSTKSLKKEANTLLDQQNNGSLHLFGFKDELEYFSSESDHEEFKDTSSERVISGKRTSLSNLNARKKVILTLKSTCLNPYSRLQSIIQPPEGKNADLLGTILESQSLWHSKNSQIEVNEDGKVKVVNKGSSQHKSKASSIIPAQARNNANCTLTTPIEDIPCESLNLNENVETHLTKINIKAEAHDAAEEWDVETVIDEIKKEPPEEKIKVELKEERKSLSESPPTVLSVQERSSASECIFDDSPNSEKSDGEGDDCPIYSMYSKASKIFSLQRYKERQGKFLPDQSEIQLMTIKKNEKDEVRENILKRHKIYQEEEKDRELKRERSPSPKRIKEENGKEVIK